MDNKGTWKAVLLISTILIVVGALTYVVSLFIRGYRPDLQKPGLGFMPTGLLVANSDPKGASVYIDEKLATATDDTLNLPPETYHIRIKKDGYLPWEKTLLIKKEVVTQANATLFKSTPDLSPLTNTGAINPTVSPDGTKIVYGVDQASKPKNNGIWLLDLSTSMPLTRSNTRQLTDFYQNINWENSEFQWGPDNKSVLLIERTGIGTDTETELEEEKNINQAFLIDATRFTASGDLNDAGFRIDLIFEEWEQEVQTDLEMNLIKLPEELKNIATASAQNISFSPDDEKIFYLATDSAKIPENLLPHPPARSSQPEEREIKPGNIYVYDLKEDTNFKIGSEEELSKLGWLTSSHLIYIDEENLEVKVVEYDATNRQTIYSGPFVNSYVFPSPSGKSLISLTSLRPNSPGNLYEIKVR
jgi:hypothetical protein